PRAANWSHCSLYPATNQRAVTKRSAKSKTFSKQVASGMQLYGVPVPK
ncbi:hypothetical protein TNCV_5073131, partial [Trichonephila clavipes]